MSAFWLGWMKGCAQFGLYGVPLTVLVLGVLGGIKHSIGLGLFAALLFFLWLEFVVPLADDALRWANRELAKRREEVSDV